MRHDRLHPIVRLSRSTRRHVSSRLWTPSRPLLALALVTLSLFVVSCAGSVTAPGDSWWLEVKSSGGITGAGGGTVTVDSSGSAVTMPPGQAVCRFHLSASELDRINTLVTAARPLSWRASYVPENPCCDRFEYELTFTRGGSTTKTRWVDDPLPMPADLTAAVDATVGGPGSIRAIAPGRCE